RDRRRNAAREQRQIAIETLDSLRDRRLEVAVQVGEPAGPVLDEVPLQSIQRRVEQARPRDLPLGGAREERRRPRAALAEPVEVLEAQNARPFDFEQAPELALDEHGIREVLVGALAVREETETPGLRRRPLAEPGHDQ